MYLEYDWMLDVYRPRFGQTFTDVRGIRAYLTMGAAKKHLRECGLKIGDKTDSRTWRIEAEA